MHRDAAILLLYILGDSGPARFQAASPWLGVAVTGARAFIAHRQRNPLRPIPHPPPAISGAAAMFGLRPGRAS